MKITEQKIRTLIREMIAGQGLPWGGAREDHQLGRAQNDEIYTHQEISDEDHTAADSTDY